MSTSAPAHKAVQSKNERGWVRVTSTRRLGGPLTFISTRMRVNNILASGLGETIACRASLPDQVLVVIANKLFHGVFTGFVRESGLAVKQVVELNTTSALANYSTEAGIIDLSSNAFTSVSQTLLDWKTLQTVDLQDNPWHCECSLQWMLDIVVAKLYKADQELLYNLKCASPAIVAEKRMVHFYNWTKPAFCSGFEQLRMKPGQNDPTSSSWLGTSNAAIIVVCSLLGVLVLLVALGIFLQRKLSARRRIKNRRF
uniref:LRRCT domain-containing protein n=1 Tax=Timema shepardi TaxID=629360 RepID=A0A7R9G2Z7_TIMSH|nr:unnamed protein product [Timema shepardi]